MSIGKQKQDDKRDTEKRKSIFTKSKRDDSGSHGINLFNEINPEYLMCFISSLLRVQASPSFVTTNNGGALKINFYYAGQRDEGEWCSGKGQLDTALDEYEQFLVEQDSPTLSLMPRWREEAIAKAYDGNE